MGGMDIKNVQESGMQMKYTGRICMSVLWRPELENKFTKVNLNKVCGAINNQTKPYVMWFINEVLICGNYQFHWISTNDYSKTARM